MDEERLASTADEEAAKAARRASIAEALAEVTEGPRIRIGARITVPLRLLGTLQEVREQRPAGA